VVEDDVDGDDDVFINNAFIVDYKIVVAIRYQLSASPIHSSFQ